MNLRFEVALESDAGFTLDTDELDGVVGLGFLKVPVTSEIRSISWKRGRDSQLDNFSAGSCTIVFDNRDRQLDPSYTGSSFYGELYPGRAISVLALQDFDGGWSPYDFAQYVFTGYTESWSFDFTLDGDATATVTITDAFSRLSKMPIVSLDVPQELSGARVQRILNYAGFPSANFNIQPGYSVLAAETIVDTNVLAYLQKVTQSEFGTMFIDGSGVFRFVQRNSTANIASVYLATNDPNGGHIIADINFDYAFDHIYNDITLNGPAYTVRGTEIASVTKYGSLAKSFDVLISSEFAAEAVASGVAALYGVPEMLPRNVEVNISERIYSHDVSQRVVEYFTYIDIGCEAYVDYVPDQLQVQDPMVYPGLVVSSQAVSATPAGITFAIQLDKQLGYRAFMLDTGFGTLDENYLGV